MSKVCEVRVAEFELTEGYKDELETLNLNISLKRFNKLSEESKKNVIENLRSDSQEWQELDFDSDFEFCVDNVLESKEEYNIFKDLQYDIKDNIFDIDFLDVDTNKLIDIVATSLNLNESFINLIKKLNLSYEYNNLKINLDSEGNKYVRMLSEKYFDILSFYPSFSKFETSYIYCEGSKQVSKEVVHFLKMLELKIDILKNEIIFKINKIISDFNVYNKTDESVIDFIRLNYFDYWFTEDGQVIRIKNI